MNKLTKSLIATALMTGLVAGEQALAKKKEDANKPKAGVKKEKHSCKAHKNKKNGKKEDNNSCGGENGCGENGCGGRADDADDASSED